MKNLNITSKVSILLICCISISLSSCKKENDLPTIPIISSSTIFSVSSNATTIKSIVISDENSSIISQGVCWSLTPNPTITVSNINVSGSPNDSIVFCRIEGLAPNNKYYARAYATNSIGTGYGEEIEFTTLNTVSDIEGNSYNTVSINEQVWMVENLKTTKYNDGSDIPFINSEWSGLETPGYCWYDFNIENKTPYGALYNWDAVVTDQLCPTGWRLPSNSDMDTLVNFLGGNFVAGGFLKSTGNSWMTPNYGATNYSGFSALPAGASSSFIGHFAGKELYTDLWTSTIEYASYYPYDEVIKLWGLGYLNGVATNNDMRVVGTTMFFYSVRCIQD